MLEDVGCLKLGKAIRHTHTEERFFKDDSSMLQVVLQYQDTTEHKTTPNVRYIFSLIFYFTMNIFSTCTTQIWTGEGSNTPQNTLSEAERFPPSQKISSS